VYALQNRIGVPTVNFHRISYSIFDYGVLIKRLVFCSIIYEKFGFKNLTSEHLPEELTTRTESGKKVIKMLHVRLVHVRKTVTDLQIFGL